MSVTFWVPDAPQIEIQCPYCTPEDNCPGYGGLGCSGTRTESEGPSANLANASVRVLFGLLGMDPVDLCGSLKHSELPDFQRRIVRLSNVENERTSAIEPPYSSGGPGTGKCTVIYGGNTDTQTLRRLRSIQRVVSWAQDNGHGIAWG